MSTLRPEVNPKTTPSNMGAFVFRIAKHSQNGKLAASVGHALREGLTPNANPALRSSNQVVGVTSTAEFMAALEARLDGIVIPRKDSPRIIEFVMSASESHFKDDPKGSKLFNASLAWLRKTHGAENVLLSVVHHDETTPHLSAFVVPIVPGTKKLSAKHFVGGRKLLSDYQTSAWEAAGRPLGLDRGLIGSKARHVDTNDWKAAMRADLGAGPEPIKLPSPTWADRIWPAKWAAPTVAKANAIVKKAQVQTAAAAQAKKAVVIETKRLVEQKKRMNTLEANMDKEVQKRTTAALDHVRQQLTDAEKLKDEYASLSAEHVKLGEEFAEMKHSRKAIIKETAIMIKASHHPAKIAALMGVKLAAGDVFDAMIKAGVATSFEDAVTQVAQRLNIEAGHGPTHMSDLSKWSLDYATAQKEEEEKDKFKP